MCITYTYSFSLIIYFLRDINQYDICSGHRFLRSAGLLHKAVEKLGHSCQLLRRPFLPLVCVSAELIKYSASLHFLKRIQRWTKLMSRMDFTYVINQILGHI